MPIAPACEVAHDPLRAARLDQCRSADADEARARKDVLDDVLGRPDTRRSPITGTLTARDTRHVASTPTGRSAAPLTPPEPKPTAGRRRSTSMTRPGTVFTTVIPLCARVDGTLRGSPDIRERRRELHEEGSHGRLARTPDEVGEHGAIGTELEPARAGVRATRR